MRVWSPDVVPPTGLVIERILTRLNSLPESPVKPQSAPVTSPFSITEAEIIAEPTTSSAALEYPDTESYVSTSLEAFVCEVVTLEQPIPIRFSRSA